MGTNYYHRTDICKECNRYKEKHIGKSSAGWQFNFQGYAAFEDMPRIASFEDWKREFQADGKIFDEYGTEVSFEGFVKIVENKNTEPLNHFDHCTEQGYDMNNDWKDKEDYAFTCAEFS